MEGIENTLIEPSDLERSRRRRVFPDYPPSTTAPVLVITHALTAANGRTIVRGSVADGGGVKSVRVNGQSARGLRGNFAEWEVTLESTSLPANPVR